MIVFNGCSFVEQSHLELESVDWKSLYWPALISKEHINLAQSGASNTRIWRTTIDHIHSGGNCTELYIGSIQKCPCPTEERIGAIEKCICPKEKCMFLKNKQRHNLSP